MGQKWDLVMRGSGGNIILFLLGLVDFQVFPRLSTCGETGVYGYFVDQGKLQNSNNRISEALEIGVRQQDSSVLFHGTDGFEIRWKIIFYSTPFKIFKGIIYGECYKQ